MKNGFTTLLILLALSGLRLHAQLGDLVVGGPNQFLIVPDDPALMPSNGLTVEAWIYYDPSLPWSSSYPTIVRKSTYTHPYILRVHAGNLHLQFGVWTNSFAYTGFDSTVSIPTNTWTHVAGTWDGTVMNLYMNGNLVGTQPKAGTMMQYAGNLNIASGIGSDESWRGRIDELRIWDHARSQAELQQSMYQALDNRPGLVASWHFDGNFLEPTSGFDAIPQHGITTQASTSPVGGLVIQAPNFAQIGHPLQFQLQGAPPNAPYFLDNSLTGTTSGIPLISPLNGVFPLDPPLLNMTFGPGAPGIFVDYLGFTDSQGNASATFNVPNFPFLIGMPLHSAFLYLTSLSPMVLGDVSPISTTTFSGPMPVLTSIVPTAGPLSGNWPLGLIGQNFDAQTVVRIGGVPATNVVLQDSTLLTCLSPAGSALGAVAVEVENFDGSTAWLTNAYTYVADLDITQVSPTDPAPGQIVTVTGSGFQTGVAVMVNGQAAMVSGASATQLQFTMPANGVCHATVFVVNPDGQAEGFVLGSAPYVTQTLGASGPWIGGTVFQVLGGNFSTAAVVTIDGAPATIVQITSSHIELISPPGLIGPAVVLITNPDGCTATTSFHYGY